MFSCSSSENDSVKQAHQQNVNSAIDEDISEFLTKAADARMTNIEQGKLAKSQGTTAAIKQYGEKMVTDQTKLLHELRVLAASKNIMLPNVISNDKKDDLEDLREEQGEEFNEAFVKMITIDHKRDVRAFEKATDFKDKDVQKFANAYLPVFESHLDQIQRIKDNESGLSEGKPAED